MWGKIRTMIALLLLCVMSAQAVELSDHTRVWLVTYSPGDDTYTSFGHSSIRIQDPDNRLDILFNYGTFDFNTEGFYWKFVKGETWYQLGIEDPRGLFEKGVTWNGRLVYWQELNMSLAEKQVLFDALEENYQPKHRYYLYNFAYDNCATRPYQMIRKACGTELVSDYVGHTGHSYRAFLRKYTGRFSWFNAGINLLFGWTADRKMNSEERLFLPEELMFYMQEAHRADTGEPFVLNSHIAPFAAPYTPWYATWPIGLVLYFLFVFGMSWYDHKRKKWSWWVELVGGIPYVLLILLVCFLTFFSCHPLVGFGWRLLIIPITHLCARLIYIIRW